MNTRLQLRVLYRQFLFRLMDVELLSASARGDASELFGQFASLLFTINVLLSLGAIMAAGSRTPPGAAWGLELRLISLTMLAVGMFAVLSWDSTFLDRRDVLVLAPLPVRGRTLFAAKVAAVAASLGLTIVVLNCTSAILWPMVLAPSGSGIVGMARFVAAFWVALLAAGAFLYCSILGVQGVAAQLPRRWFLRVSAGLQIGAFVLFLTVFTLQPYFATVTALGAAGNQRALAWLPVYWFLGLASELSGSLSRQGNTVMAPLAARAVAGLAVSMAVAACAFVLSYFRTLRKIVEEPDVLPGARGGIWLPRFGSATQTALVQFIIRTLMRSRQHRMILAFYLGFGFAIVTMYMATPVTQRMLHGGNAMAQANVPMLVSSVIVLCAWLLGTRVVFAIPLDLGANWVFRVTPVEAGGGSLPAARRALMALAVAPACLGTAALFLWMWPWQPVVKHLAMLALFGILLTEALLAGFRKIPFTCSYLPGKSKVHIGFWLCFMVVVQAVQKCVEFEMEVMGNVWEFWLTVLLLCAAAGLGGWLLRGREKEILYEEFARDELIVLGLGR